MSNSVAASIIDPANLLTQAHGPLKKVVPETDHTTTLFQQDREHAEAPWLGRRTTSAAPPTASMPMTIIECTQTTSPSVQPAETQSFTTK